MKISSKNQDQLIEGLQDLWINCLGCGGLYTFNVEGCTPSILRVVHLQIFQRYISEYSRFSFADKATTYVPLQFEGGIFSRPFCHINPLGVFVGRPGISWDESLRQGAELKLNWAPASLPPPNTSGWKPKSWRFGESPDESPLLFGDGYKIPAVSVRGFMWIDWFTRINLGFCNDEFH